MKTYPPTLTHFANVLNRLVLVLVLVLPVALYAGESVTEKADSDQLEPCEPASNTETGDATSNQAVPRESCEQLSQEQEEEARQEILEFLDDVRAEIHSMQGGVATKLEEVNERVDLTERMLLRASRAQFAELRETPV